MKKLLKAIGWSFLIVLAFALEFVVIGAVMYLVHTYSYGWISLVVIGFGLLTWIVYVEQN